VLDADGKVIDELPASPRRGLNRVVWSMREKPPVVPPAAQLAYAGSQGPMVLPGTYSVRMTKGSEVYDSKILVELDRRATYTLADRKAQYDAAMRVRALFGEQSALMDRILALRSALADRVAAAGSEALKQKISAFDGQVDAVRKQIVATTEGGAITGEERLREFTDTLYGAILSWEGAPTAYQVERIGVLESSLADINDGFSALLDKDLPALNKALKAGKLPVIETPPLTAAVADSGLRPAGSGGGEVGEAGEAGNYRSLPTSMVVYH
jgi:hypothetical protein